MAGVLDGHNLEDRSVPRLKLIDDFYTQQEITDLLNALQNALNGDISDLWALLNNHQARHLQGGADALNGTATINVTGWAQTAYYAP